MIVEKSQQVNTVKLLVGDHPKCEDLVVAYEKRTTGVSSENMSGHICFREDNLLYAISKS